MKPYRIVLADDHVIFRQGIKKLLDKKAGLEVIGESNNSQELLILLKDLIPDMIVLVISMPGVNGIEVIREIKSFYPQIKLLILTIHKNKEYLYHSISEGAHGYLVKEDSDVELFSAIDTIQNDKIYITNLLLKELTEDLLDLYQKDRQPSELLTRREKEILKLIAKGKSNKQIGNLLFISTRTVENHRANIMKKLKLKKTADLVRYAIKKGYIIPSL